MKILKRIALCIFLLTGIGALTSITGEAAEFNFAVTPQIPDNQIDKSKTYFDLQLTPDQKQELTVNLRNDTDQEVIVEAQINSATTNSNGVVEYSTNEIKPDSSLTFNLKDYVEAPGEVTLAPHSETEYKLNIHMPNEAFDGVIAGGITFQEKSAEETAASSEESSGLAIKNEYSYVVALLMRQTTENGSPDLKLLAAGADQVNARTLIYGNLQNPNPVYLNQLAAHMTVTKQGASEIIYENTQTGMQMAPNSNFNLGLPLNGERLSPGKYVLKVDAYGQKDEAGEFTLANADGEAENYRYNWQLEKEFEIKADEARKLNDGDVTVKKDFTWLYILIGVILLLLIILFIWYKKKHEKK
ncbi:DUF916 and DUF3324 domain-containing protein [Enterococcus sp. 669A]|uniref:DUF916 and DUF3324 domain-containing protein n=1 Tax=Candidatus Enterococcus moelleringii TaxID=2815325 RepID=A0ABS3L8J9_9ENTE|nr:DUF916 and DUF3324 domain-containing protein [Enterococcus sp. 669A]MBO1305952.1 DUF916 and DUF3324 domain-containing protein [Enterococcus sp. 669A]